MPFFTPFPLSRFKPGTRRGPPAAESDPAAASAARDRPTIILHEIVKYNSIKSSKMFDKPRRCKCEGFLDDRAVRTGLAARASGPGMGRRAAPAGVGAGACAAEHGEHLFRMGGSAPGADGRGVVAHSAQFARCGSAFGASEFVNRHCLPRCLDPFRVVKPEGMHTCARPPGVE